MAATDRPLCAATAVHHTLCAATPVDHTHGDAAGATLPGPPRPM